MNCSNTETTEPSPAFLYICNGQSRSCKSFLIFRSHPPYSSVSTISNLTSADATELARINNVSTSATFPNEKEVIIPVTSTIYSIIHSQTSATVDTSCVIKQLSPIKHLSLRTSSPPQSSINPQIMPCAMCHAVDRASLFQSIDWVSQSKAPMTGDPLFYCRSIGRDDDDGFGLVMCGRGGD
ncbi:hypothetical protein ACFE04_029425 [Oxalis oulophora]